MSQYDLAKSIFSRAFPHEIFVSQTAESWCDDFPLLEAVIDYYADLGASDVNIENYGNSILLPSLARLWQHQVGYRYHGLIGERIEDWDDDWLVVADQGADPFIYSHSSGKILHAFHGEGEWQPSELFASLPAMVTAFAMMGEIVIKAGDDLTDANSHLNERFIIAAKEKLSRVLNSESEAAAVLATFGWSRLASQSFDRRGNIRRLKISVGRLFYFMPGWGLVIIVLIAILSLLLTAVLLLAYFSPLLVALQRGHQDTVAIFLLTFFLGWTLLGWIIALVWAFGTVRPRVVDRR